MCNKCVVINMSIYAISVLLLTCQCVLNVCKKCVAINLSVCAKGSSRDETQAEMLPIFTKNGEKWFDKFTQICERTGEREDLFQKHLLLYI